MEISVELQNVVEWLPIAWIVAATQIVGLTSAWLARLAEGSRRQASCQCLFMLSLAVVGLTTGLSLCLNAGGWFLSGTTLSLMVVAATIDCGRSERPAFF